MTASTLLASDAAGPRRAPRALVFASAFLLGAALMAFEILVSRLLTPYFGGGIYTWASLISVVLFAMMIGYFVGGHLVDRWPSLRLAALFAAAAGLWFMGLPLFSTPLLESVMLSVEDEVIGVMIASAAVQLPPIAALGAFSPIAIRVTLDRVEHAGATAGAIYAVSTIGNVLGTLGAALYLIPHFATSTAILGIGALCFCVAAALWIAGR